MNITDVSAIRECTSCSMCSAVCPVEAISIHLDSDGFYRPVVNDKCIDCGLCTKVCYKFDDKINMTDDNSLEHYNLFGASVKDKALLKQTTSGGVADILAKTLISKGYSCIGVVYDTETNTAKSCVANDIADTDKFRGSKYIQSYTEEAFKQLVRGLKQNDNSKYAVFGLPCQIYAINRYLTLRGLRDRCLLIDLYCHGCPSLNAWKKYVRNILQTTGGCKIDSAIFRSKIRGWGSGFYVEEVAVDGIKTPIIGKIGADPFFELFFSNSVLNSSCPDCMLRSTLEYTDIRLGDFWGKTYIDNHTGVSAVSVVTPKGKDLWDNIKENLNFEQRQFSEFLPFQSWHHTYTINDKARRETLDVLSDDNSSIQDAIDTLRRYETPAQRVKRIAKQNLFRFPGLVRFLKKYM